MINSLSKTEVGLIKAIFSESVKLLKKAGFKLIYSCFYTDNSDEVIFHLFCDSLNPFYFIGLDLFHKGFITNMQFNYNCVASKDKPYYVSFIVSRSLPF